MPPRQGRKRELKALSPNDLAPDVVALTNALRALERRSIYTTSRAISAATVGRSGPRVSETGVSQILSPSPKQSALRPWEQYCSVIEALGADPEEYRERWEEAHAAHLALRQSRSGVTGGPDAAGPARADPAVIDGPADRRDTRRRVMLLAGCLVATIVLASSAYLIAHSDGASAPQGLSPQVAGPTTTSPGILTHLHLAGVGSATMFFGPLESLVSSFPHSRFAVSPTALQQHAHDCAETVVVSGAPGSAGAVYAQGITLWDALEFAPSQVLDQPYAELHQQIIAPPPDVRPGYAQDAAILVRTDANLDVDSEAARLSLAQRSGRQETWEGAGQYTRCEASR